MTDWAIDFSQFKEFQKCNALWYEKYIAKTRLAPKLGQQDSALTLGTLYHDGMRVLREHGIIEISASAIQQADPTPECLAWARTLVAGYARHYPEEHFELYSCEEPIKFPLPSGLQGLAKVDYYFELNQPTQLATGLGDFFTLTPGFWVKEYKTKANSIKLGNYVMQYRVNMQPDFQSLALQAKLGEPIQGVLIDVAEKPKITAPQRKCPACKTTSDYSDWIPTGEGYSCPGCGAIKDLAPIKEKAPPEASYFRISAARNQDRLARSLRQINTVAQEMYQAQLEGRVMEQLSPATETFCVESIYGPCAYFGMHSEGQFAAGAAGFVQIEDPWEYLKR